MKQTKNVSGEGTRKLIGKKVKWILTWYGSVGEPTFRTGKVVAEDGNWLVIRADVFPTIGANPFVTKRIFDIELA